MYIRNLQGIYIIISKENSMLYRSVYVTGPARIRHICTHNLALFLNFNLQYLLKYKCYGNEIFMPYLKIKVKEK